MRYFCACLRRGKRCSTSIAKEIYDRGRPPGRGNSVPYPCTVRLLLGEEPCVLKRGRFYTHLKASERNIPLFWQVFVYVPLPRPARADISPVGTIPLLRPYIFFPKRLWVWAQQYKT